MICRSLGEYWEETSNLTAEDERKLKLDLWNLLAALSIAQFGAPKDLNHVTNVYSSRKLDDLRVSEILSKVQQMFQWNWIWT